MAAPNIVPLIRLNTTLDAGDTKRHPPFPVTPTKTPTAPPGGILVAIFPPGDRPIIAAGCLTLVGVPWICVMEAGVGTGVG